MEILVVIPTYNEADNIRPLGEALFGLGLDLGILIVDDNSPDGTGRIADELAAANPRFMVLHRPGKLGLGTAYREGFTWALNNTDAPLLAQMDADFSHHPERLPALVEAARTGAVAVGSRYVPGGGVKNWGLGRRMLSRGASLYVGTVLGLPVNDLTGAFKCWPRRVLERLDLATLKAGGFAALSEMTYRAHLLGYGFVEVPIIFEDRRVGQSKLTPAIALEAFLNVWRLRFSKDFDPKDQPPA
jgi:dolichol-phosphate mannosyltransferase